MPRWPAPREVSSYISYIIPHSSKAVISLTDLIVLEIGVFRGFSAMVWSHAVGPTGTVTGLEKSPEYAAFAKKALADHDIKNVTVIEGDALET